MTTPNEHGHHWDIDVPSWSEDSQALYSAHRETSTGARWREDDRDTATLIDEAFQPPRSPLSESFPGQHVPEGDGTRFIHDGEPHPAFYDPNAGRPQPYPL